MTPGELAEPLRYSAMSIGRAFDELAAAKLAHINRVGRRKEISFAAPPRLLLDLAKTLLVSPSRTERPVKWLGRPPRLPRAGLYGLAARTGITADEQSIYALTPERFTLLKEDGQLEEARDAYDADAILQTWRYDPAALSADDVVDPLSLYAEFLDNPDERISYAAQKLVEKLPHRAASGHSNRSLAFS